MIKIKYIKNKVWLDISHSFFSDFIVYKFYNLVLIYKQKNVNICPNCIFLYNLDYATYNLIKYKMKTYANTKSTTFESLFSILEQEKIKFIINKCDTDEDECLIIANLNDWQTKKFKFINTFKHFLCPCDYYQNTDFQKHIGDYALIKSIEEKNSEIMEYFDHSFFKSNFVYFSYFYNPLSLLNDSYMETDLAIGIDYNRNIAKLKSLMESIERYSIFLPQYYTGIKEVDKNAFCLIKNNEIIFQMASSNGFAASDDFLMAKRNSLIELLERDSLMSLWIHNQKFKKVNKSSLPTIFRKYISELEYKGFKTYIYNLYKYKGIYCFLIVTINVENEPFIKTGIGSHDSCKSESLNKAFGELLIGIFFDYKFPLVNSTQGSDFHLNYYRTHIDSEQKIKNLEPLFSNQNNVDWNDIFIKSNHTCFKDIDFFDYTIDDGSLNKISIIKTSQSKFFPLYFKGFSKDWCKMYYTDVETEILNNKPHPFP